jgi:acyl carrier protein
VKEGAVDELKEAVLKYVIEEYAGEGDTITCDTPLISSGLVDSFSMVSLKRFLEVTYKISIPDEEASPEAFDSVNKIAELVTRFTSPAPAR